MMGVGGGGGRSGKSGEDGDVIEGQKGFAYESGHYDGGG